jgi:cytidylate kinase
LSRRGLVIAIDGPAASGKSTTARGVAERLDYLHLDTGAMYRAVTLKILRSGIPPSDEERIAELVARTTVGFRRSGKAFRVLLDGEDVSGEIRSPAVTRAVSAVSSQPSVRDAMVREQRKLGMEGGIVMDGRDIGTVVFPDADLKVFLVAGITTRAGRRHKELRQGGTEADPEALQREIEERDRLDSTRASSPLKRADDAIVIDTSDLTIDDQVAIVLEHVRKRMKEMGIE